MSVIVIAGDPSTALWGHTRGSVALFTGSGRNRGFHRGQCPQRKGRGDSNRERWARQSAKGWCCSAAGVSLTEQTPWIFLALVLVQSLSRDPTGCSTPGLPVHHQLPELAQTHVRRVGDAIQPSHPLSPPSPSAFSLSQHQGLL